MQNKVKIKSDPQAERNRSRSSEEAYHAAIRLDPDELEFEFFDPLNVQEIRVTGEDGSQYIWRSDEFLLQRAANDLLIASKNLLTVLKERQFAESCDNATLKCLKEVQAAIDRADGRTA